MRTWHPWLMALVTTLLSGSVVAQSTATPTARKPRPQLGSAVALAPDGQLWLAGVNPQGQLFVQTAPDATPLRWNAPRVLDTQGDPISADGENRPKLAFGPNDQVVLSYTQPLPRPNTGWVRMLRSTDGGRSFTPPFTVHEDRQEITHRFESIGFDAQGVLHTLWIDKRDLERAPKVGKKSSYRGAAIYRNMSHDGGASFGPDLRVADHSCECCRIALTPGLDGRLRAMWRHVFAPNVRDHAFALIDTTPTPAPAVPVRASEDNWHVDACPHHGPALVAAEGGGYHTVWFGIRQQDQAHVPAVRYGRLNAEGASLPDTVRPLPDERAEHADIAAHGLRVAVVWRSVEGARSRLHAWLSTNGGQRFDLHTLDEVHGDNDFPRLVQRGARMLAVWRHPLETKVYELPF